MGVPSTYTQEIADEICARLVEGESLRSVCRDNAMPSTTTVMRWVSEKEYFREQYAHAILLRADAKFEELDDVSEEAVRAETAVEVQGLRLKADNIKWQLARMNAKKYGDKMQTEVTGSLKHDHAIGLSAETAELIAGLKAGSSDTGDAAPLPD